MRISSDVPCVPNKRQLTATSLYYPSLGDPQYGCTLWAFPLTNVVYLPETDLVSSSIYKLDWQGTTHPHLLHPDFFWRALWVAADPKLSQNHKIIVNAAARLHRWGDFIGNPQYIYPSIYKYIHFSAQNRQKTNSSFPPRIEKNNNRFFGPDSRKWFFDPETFFLISLPYQSTTPRLQYFGRIWPINSIVLLISPNSFSNTPRYNPKIVQTLFGSFFSLFLLLSLGRHKKRRKPEKSEITSPLRERFCRPTQKWKHCLQHVWNYK